MFILSVMILAVAFVIDVVVVVVLIVDATDRP